MSRQQKILVALGLPLELAAWLLLTIQAMPFLSCALGVTGFACLMAVIAEVFRPAADDRPLPSGGER